MSDLFATLAAHTLGLVPTIQPRLASRFGPSPLILADTRPPPPAPAEPAPWGPPPPGLVAQADAQAPLFSWRQMQDAAVAEEAISPVQSENPTAAGEPFFDSPTLAPGDDSHHSQGMAAQPAASPLPAEHAEPALPSLPGHPTEVPQPVTASMALAPASAEPRVAPQDVAPPPAEGLTAAEPPTLPVVAPTHHAGAPATVPVTQVTGGWAETPAIGMAAPMVEPSSTAEFSSGSAAAEPAGPRPNPSTVSTRATTEVPAPYVAAADSAPVLSSGHHGPPSATAVQRAAEAAIELTAQPTVVAAAPVSSPATAGADDRRVPASRGESPTDPLAEDWHPSAAPAHAIGDVQPDGANPIEPAPERVSIEPIAHSAVPLTSPSAVMADRSAERPPSVIIQRSVAASAAAVDVALTPPGPVPVTTLGPAVETQPRPAVPASAPSLSQSAVTGAEHAPAPGTAHLLPGTTMVVPASASAAVPGTSRTAHPISGVEPTANRTADENPASPEAAPVGPATPSVPLQTHVTGRAARSVFEDETLVQPAPTANHAAHVRLTSLSPGEPAIGTPAGSSAAIAALDRTAAGAARSVSAMTGQPAGTPSIVPEIGAWTPDTFETAQPAVPVAIGDSPVAETAGFTPLAPSQAPAVMPGRGDAVRPAVPSPTAILPSATTPGQVAPAAETAGFTPLAPSQAPTAVSSRGDTARPAVPSPAAILPSAATPGQTAPTISPVTETAGFTPLAPPQTPAVVPGRGDAASPAVPSPTTNLPSAAAPGQTAPTASPVTETAGFAPLVPPQAPAVVPGRDDAARLAVSSPTAILPSAAAPGQVAPTASPVAETAGFTLLAPLQAPTVVLDRGDAARPAVPAANPPSAATPAQTAPAAETAGFTPLAPPPASAIVPMALGFQQPAKAPVNAHGPVLQSPATTAGHIAAADRTVIQPVFGQHEDEAARVPTSTQRTAAGAAAPTQASHAFGVTPSTGQATPPPIKAPPPAGAGPLGTAERTRIVETEQAMPASIDAPDTPETPGLMPHITNDAAPARGATSVPAPAGATGGAAPTRGTPIVPAPARAAANTLAAPAQSTNSTTNVHAVHETHAAPAAPRAHTPEPPAIQPTPYSLLPTPYPPTPNPQPPPPIRITIGRIDVRMSAPPPAANPPRGPTRPTVSLDDYLSGSGDIR